MGERNTLDVPHVSPIDSINAVLALTTDTDFEVEEGTDTADGQACLNLFLKAGCGTRQRLFITSFPRHTAVSALAAAGCVGQFFYQLGLTHSALRKREA